MSGFQGLRRYSRHLLIPEVGVQGQRRLQETRALCIGAGGLGAPVLSYLAAAGVGRIGIMDADVVDETNLQRQVLFATSDIGRVKVEVAAERLRAMNPLISVDPMAVEFDERNGRELVRLYDVILDCTDRFESRYLINDACVLEQKPDVYSSIFRFDGQVSVFGFQGGPCYRCLFPEAPPAHSVPTCAEGGVLGVLAGMVGSFAANEALKLLLGIGEPLAARMLLVDASVGATQEVRFARDPQCVLCGDSPSLTDLRLETVSDFAPRVDVEEIGAAQLDRALAQARLLDVREPHEAVLGTVEGAIAIPASQLEARMHELDTADRYIVACRVGERSRWAVARLRDAGFKKLGHLEGGLLAYAVYDHALEIF